MPNKIDFLNRFYSLSKEDGINEETLFKASKEIYGDESAYVIDFFGGIADVVYALEEKLDNEISEFVDLGAIKSTTQKVRACLLARIYADGERQKFYKNLSEYYSQKENLISGLKSFWNRVDYIWYLAGDSSSDWNYYSKRAILFSIYTRCFKEYLKMEPSNLKLLEEKIDLGLERVKKIHKLKEKIKPSKVPFLRQFIK